MAAHVKVQSAVAPTRELIKLDEVLEHREQEALPALEAEYPIAHGWQKEEFVAPTTLLAVPIGQEVQLLAWIPE